MMDETEPLNAVRSRGQRRSQYFVSGIISISLAFLVTMIVLSSSRRIVLDEKNKDCPDELLEIGGCHVDGNEVIKDEDISEKWATTDWMNGYDDVTGQDVVSDEYVPWVDKLNAELGDPNTVTLPALPLLPPSIPANVQVVSGTTVIVPTCDPLWGCKRNLACVDKWDWRSPYGACDAYADWTRRMGYCDSDVDMFGVPASVACPVSCDTCPLGRCYDPYSKALTACAGGASG